VVKRAQRLLMHKLGLCREEDRLTNSQLQEYAAILASPLGLEQVEAIASLFGLTCHADAAIAAEVDVEVEAVDRVELPVPCGSW
jgi:hypothetical protein